MRLFALVSTHTDSGAAILPRHYWRLLRVCVASVPPYRCGLESVSANALGASFGASVALAPVEDRVEDGT
eukprot:3766711-Rhodomonas_salina.5